MPRKNRDASVFLRKIFGIAPDQRKKRGRLMRSVDRIKYIVISIIFAAILGAVFDRNLWKLYNEGGDVSNALEGTFSVLMPLIFAIIGVYLIVLVLHPHFEKRPVPASVERMIKEKEKDIENMTREELLGLVNELESKDEEVKAYLDTIGVKTDIAVTLGASLAAFFSGMYGYMISYTIGYDSSPNLLLVTLCFMYIIFSIVYVIMKTMNVVWDV